MSTNIVLRQTVLVRRPADDVFAHLADVAHATTWRADLRESAVSTVTPLDAQPANAITHLTRRVAGDVRTGSVVCEVSIVLGRRLVNEFLVGVFQRPRRLTLNHLVGALPVTRELTCVEWPAGTEVTYTVTVAPRGNWAALTPYLRRHHRRTMAQSLARLRRELEAAAPHPAGSGLAVAA